MIDPRFIGSYRPAMRWISYIVAVVVLLGTSNVVLPCMCITDLLANEMAADHSCCAGAEDATTEAGTKLTKRCLDGCGETEHIGAVAQGDAPESLTGPTVQPAPTATRSSTWTLAALEPVLTYSASRGPPPDTVPTKLARLQIWRC
ncbi:MAG: hypothetical protein ACI9MR_001588 [Myxococcota bacterium]|jgi:hypothetical protein